MLTLLLYVVLGQEAAKVTTPTEVVHTITHYEVVSVQWQLPIGILDPLPLPPGPPAKPLAAVPPGTAIRTPPTILNPPPGAVSPQPQAAPDWLFVIVYADNRGVVYEDRHVGPYLEPADVPPGSAQPPSTEAESYVRWLMTQPFSSSASQQKWALQHLIAEGKIPASTPSGAPLAPPSSAMKAHMQPPVKK